MSGFGGERGRAHTAIEAASDALAAAFVQHLADIGCNLQYQFANQFAVEKSLAHSAAKSAKPACLALLLQAGTPLLLQAGSIFFGYTVAEAAAKGPCAAVAAEGAAEWSVRVAAAQAAPSCPCSLPGAERLRGGGGVGGRELVAAGADAEVLLLAAADATHLLAAQAPHAAPRERRGWRSGRQRRARTAQASGATRPAMRGGARLVRTKLGTFLGRCTGSGRCRGREFNLSWASGAGSSWPAAFRTGRAATKS